MIALLLSVLAVPLDKPAQVETVKVAEGELHCTYYERYLVKELTGDAKGALSLSFVQLGAAKPVCSVAVLENETVVSDWAGYFRGVAGDLVIFDGDDGWNGGMPFVIYDGTTGKRVHEDARAGDFDVTPELVRYRRLVTLDCNAIADDACAQKGAAAAATKQNVKALCTKGYAKARAAFNKSIAKLKCDAACKQGRNEQMASFMSASSVLSFDGTLDRKTWTYTPRGNAECWWSN